MVAGIRINNTDGTVQIDQDFTAFGLLDKGMLTMALDGASHPQPIYLGQVTVTGANPVLAIAAAELTCIYGLVNSGDDWTFYLRSQSSAAFDVDWWAFDSAAQAIGINDTYGIRVFRADGSLAFHSSMRFLHMIDIAMATPPADGVTHGSHAITETRSYASGHTYAVVQGSVCYHEETFDSELGPGPLDPGTKWQEYQQSQSASRVDGADVTFGMAQFEDYFNMVSLSASESGRTFGDLNFWIIDVTNF